MRVNHASLLVVLCILAGACSSPGSPEGVTPSAISTGPMYGAELVCQTNNQQAFDAYNEGVTAESNGDTDAAMSAYRRAIALDPGYCDAMDNLGVLLRRQGQIDEAIEWYRKSLAVAPDNPVAHMNLGLALRLQGDLDGAEAEYLALVEIDPENPEGHFGLGTIALDRGLPADAIPHFTRAKDLYHAHSDPWEADAAYQLGLAYALTDDCTAALTHFEPLYLANTEIAELNWYMGLCYLYPETEDLELAKKHLLEAQRLGIEIPPELQDVIQ